VKILQGLGMTHRPDLDRHEGALAVYELTREAWLKVR
jgi:hypothetical protein